MNNKKLLGKIFKSNKDNIVVEITENGNEDESSANTMRDFSLVNLKE